MGRPRIRYIKPEIWLSRDFRSLSVIGRLTFVALISNADDEGRLKTDPAHLALTYMPGCEPFEIATQLEAMEDRRMVITYSAKGVHYVALLGWADHQRVSHPVASKLPEPPKFRRRTDNGSQLVLSSSPEGRKNKETGSANKRPSDLDSLARPSEPVGSRARLRTPSSSSATVSSPTTITDISVPETGTALALVADVPVLRTPVQQVFDAWIASTERSGRTQLDAKRERLIAAALKAYPLEDVLAAVQGWKDSAHHRGENDTRTVYNDLELLLRDAKHIEQFRDYRRRAPSTLPAPQETRLDRWTREVMGGARGGQ